MKEPLIVSLFEPLPLILAIALVISIGISLGLYIRAHRKASTSQQATAMGNSTVKQSGRDIIDIGTMNSTHIASQGDLFLADGEQLVPLSTSREEFSAQVSAQWNTATQYVSGVSIYGRPFMPAEDELTAILCRGIALRMVLLDPDTKAARDFAVDECRFSRTLYQSHVLAQVLRIDEFDPELIYSRVREELTGTVAMLAKIKREHPEADIQVRYIDFLPDWKGTIIDGASAVYVLYDVPRLEVPFRLTFDTKLIDYYADRYADRYFRQGQEVSL